MNRIVYLAVLLAFVPVAFSGYFLFSPSSGEYIPANSYVRLDILPAPVSYSIYYLSDNESIEVVNTTYTDNEYVNLPAGRYKITDGTSEYYFTATTFWFGSATQFITPYMWILLIVFIIFILSRVVR